MNFHTGGQNPVVDDMLEHMENHAEDVGYSIVSAMINHHVLTFNILSQVDPEIMSNLNRILVLHHMKQLSDEAYTQRLQEIVKSFDEAYQRSLTSPYYH